MKKILVPCDFSDTAIKALRFACEIASKSKGEVFVLNVIELPHLPNSVFVPVKAYEDVLMKDHKAKAKKHFEKLREKWAGKLKVSLITDFGSVSNSIYTFIDKKRIDLVVMGTHGASGLREFTVGSNTEKIVRLASVPVISVHTATKLASLKHIIFPTRFDLADKRLINSVKALQKFLKATLQVVYVNTPSVFTRDSDIEKKMIQFIGENQLKNCNVHVYNDYNEESGIQNFAAKFNGKMIAMGTHGRKGINHLMSGSIAEDLVNHIDCPIWTLAAKS
jgi:nucleotide-binding universal stress UspA family protein